MAATRSVTSRTGRSARPASSHDSPATIATSTGPTAHSTRVVACSVSRTSSSVDAVDSTAAPIGSDEIVSRSAGPSA